MDNQQDQNEADCGGSALTGVLGPTLDPLYEKAVAVFKARPEEAGHALLQNTFLIGYNRANRLIDQMFKDELLSRVFDGVALRYCVA